MRENITRICAQRHHLTINKTAHSEGRRVGRLAVWRQRQIDTGRSWGASTASIRPPRLPLLTCQVLGRPTDTRLAELVRGGTLMDLAYADGG